MCESSHQINIVTSLLTLSKLRMSCLRCESRGVLKIWYKCGSELISANRFTYALVCIIKQCVEVDFENSRYFLAMRFNWKRCASIDSVYPDKSVKFAFL